MTKEKKIRGACPLDCPDGCAWQVTVRSGVPVDLKGVSDHPITRGALCVKVNNYLEHTKSPDRLLYPMRRVGKKGDGKFIRISWDEALSEIAKRLGDIISEYGGEAIWPYQGTGSLGFLQGIQGKAGNRLWNVLGASKHDMTICSIAGLTGLEYLLGSSKGIAPESLVDSKLIILWGTNTLTSGYHQWHFIKAAKQKGAYVVVIDPVRTRTAQQADEHLAPLPGTDAALAMGLLNVIIGLGGENKTFLDQKTIGWGDFRKRILEFPPKLVSAITGVDEFQIIALGTRIAKTRPTAIRASQGVQRHAGGGMTLRALASIPSVTGDWDLAGGGLVFSTDGYFGGNRDALFRDDLLKKNVRKLSMTRLGEGLLENCSPPVKALFVYAANPVASSPHQEKIRKGLVREDLFTVVIEQFATDTIDYADIVLPATMQTEHIDLHDSYGHLYIAWNEAAVAAPGECLSTTETFRRLAKKMNLSESCLYDSDETLAEQLLNSDHFSLNGITLRRLREQGWMRLNYPNPFVPYANGFPTASGKLEFYSEQAQLDGYDSLPGFTPPKEVLDMHLAKKYPFALVTGASHYFINTIFGNHKGLRKRAGKNQVIMNAEDAKIRNILDGQLASVFNSRGSFLAEVKIGNQVTRGVLATTKGQWLKLSSGSNVNATVDERDADMGGGAVFGDNRVNIELQE